MFALALVAALVGGGETAPAETIAVRAQGALDAVVVFPNPYRPDDGLARTGTPASGIVFANLPAGARVEVFTTRGERIFLARTEAAGDLRWTAVTDRGRPAPSGLYLWSVVGDGGRRAGRLAIVR